MRAIRKEMSCISDGLLQRLNVPSGRADANDLDGKMPEGREVLDAKIKTAARVKRNPQLLKPRHGPGFKHQSFPIAPAEVLVVVVAAAAVGSGDRGSVGGRRV
uniref:Uncharacterized protein n=1 Tax=Aegilops tauschii TaxID=37682 RepID=N1QZN2_AEGTA